MKQILKYPLTFDTSQSFFLPYGFNIVHFGVDPRPTTNAGLAMWAEVHVGEAAPANTTDVTVGVFATGQDVPEHWEYFRTVSTQAFAWHLYLQPY